MEHPKRLTTRKIALIAIFSALYYVLSFLPGIRAVTGAADVTIQIEAFMASIFGLILGPYLGALTAFLGALLAWILPPGIPSPTSAVFLPAPVVNAFVVGLIYTRKWKIAFVTLAAVVSVFWLLPPTQPWEQFFDVGFYVMWDKILALALIIPAVALISRTEKASAETRDNASKARFVERIDLTLILSVIAAALIIANAWMVISAGKVLDFQYVILGTNLRLRFGFKDVISLTASYSYVWLFLGAGILVCGVLLYFKPKKRFVWSATVFVLSCLSAVIGGGFFVGLFLGVLSGIFGTLKRRFALRKITLFRDGILYFVLAFIGNEADNALGADIFAVPIVYEGIFGIPLEVVRPLFTVAPFFYFAIRLFQAIVTALIATPLLRNLKGSGLT